MTMQGCTLEADLVSLRELVHVRLENYVAAASAPDSSDCPATLRDAMAYSLLAGGKRMRPVLVLLACEACGGSIDHRNDLRVGLVGHRLSCFWRDQQAHARRVPFRQAERE